MYARYAAGLPRFLRRPITVEQARDLVRRGLEQREERFLRLIERGVLTRPQSPYARLLREAGFAVHPVYTVDREVTLKLARRAGLCDLRWWRDVAERSVRSDMEAIAAIGAVVERYHQRIFFNVYRRDDSNISVPHVAIVVVPKLHHFVAHSKL